MRLASGDEFGDYAGWLYLGGAVRASIDTGPESWPDGLAKEWIQEAGSILPFSDRLRQPDNHPAFTSNGPETHGFASLPRDRFAFIVCNRST